MLLITQNRRQLCADSENIAKLNVGMILSNGASTWAHQLLRVVLMAYAQVMASILISVYTYRYMGKKATADFGHNDHIQGCPRLS